jgi:hypothetical protein
LGAGFAKQHGETQSLLQELHPGLMDLPTDVLNFFSDAVGDLLQTGVDRLAMPARVFAEGSVSLFYGGEVASESFAPALLGRAQWSEASRN